MTTFHYPPAANHFTDFTDHEPLTATSPSGTTISIDHGMITVAIEERGTVTIGQLLSFKGHGLAVSFAASSVTGVVLGIPTMTTLIGLLDQIAGPVPQ